MKRAWLFMELVFAFAAATLVMTACVLFIPKAKEHDILDIATAIGTVGAAVAAVWIATNEGRRRKKEALDIANLTASSMAWRVTHDAAKVGIILDLLQEAKHVDQSPERFAEYQQELADVCNWTLSDLLPLAPLPQSCAVNLAQGADQVKTCSLLIKISVEGNGTTTSDGRRKLATQAHEFLAEGYEALLAGARQCKKVAGH